MTLASLGLFFLSHYMEMVITYTAGVKRSHLETMFLKPLI